MPEWLRAITAVVISVIAFFLLLYLWLSLCGIVTAAQGRALQTLDKMTPDVLPPVEKPLPLTTQTAAERRAAIQECEQRGGLPVVIAGIVSSRGIGCAQQLGD